MQSDRQTKRYYDTHAATWAGRKTNSFHHQKQFEQFIAYLPDKAAVLDIGCAAGIHVPLFLGIGRHLRYHGIDISRSFLKLAQRRYPQLTFDQADILDERTLPKQRFHGFWAGAVLMHIPLEHWPHLFENIERITRPGAIGYLTLPVAHPSGPHAQEDPRHFTLLDAKEQRKWLRSRRWQILKSGTIDGFTTEAVWRWYIVQLP